MTTEGLDKLSEIVPQTGGEALMMYPFIKKYIGNGNSHEWCNRTTIENATWLIKMYKRELKI